MASILPSPEYTLSVRYEVAADPRWIALCGSLRGKPLSHCRVMDKSTFERLEADLGHDPDFPVMHVALEGFFHWLDFMDLFAREMRRRQPHHLSLLQDVHSSALAQALHNRGWHT
ncbi:hypothetical protein LIER_38233 [Lithospermum erythrorhizon]|uniref:Uncharacterized protein n=1 Tax=Lithospermum erythrorhizon TaxID=34254 RepID=A0AAV3PWN1_LITER